MMSVLEAAKRVLEEAGSPLPVRDLTKAMLAKGYWQTQGLTPEATVQARLATDIKNRGEASAFIRSAPGRFGLRGQVTDPVSAEVALVGTPMLFEDEVEEVDPTATPDTLSFTEAAIEVLQELDPPRPLHYREITRLAIDKKLLNTRGKTPEATMYAQIHTEIERYTKRGLQPRFQKLGQGMLSLTNGGISQGIAKPWTSSDQEFLGRIKNISPGQFERLVARLLAQIFGGADIKETPLGGDGGLDARGPVTLPGGISVELVAQAKKYTTTNVRRPEVQNFRGSMGTQSLGLFITTTDFSRGAIQEAKRSTAIHPMGLIAGKELVGLMKQHKVDLDAQGEPVLVDE